jgi:hypothetical protein
VGHRNHRPSSVAIAGVMNDRTTSGVVKQAAPEGKIRQIEAMPAISRSYFEFVHTVSLLVG